MEDHKQTQNDALSPSLPAKSAPLKAEVSSQLPNPQSSQLSLTPAQEAAFLTRLNTLLTSTDDLASAIPVPQRSPAYLDSLRTSTGPSFLTNLHSLFNSLQSRAVELFEEYKGKRKMSRLMQRQKEALDRAAQVELEDMLAREQRLQVHLQDIKSAANSHEIEEDAIKKTVLQVNRDLSETEVMLRSLKRVRDDLQVQLDRLESNLNQLRQKEYSLDEEATYLEEEVKSLRAQIKEKEMLLDERSCMFQTISLENEELLDQLVDLEVQLFETEELSTPQMEVIHNMTDVREAKLREWRIELNDQKAFFKMVESFHNSLRKKGKEGFKERVLAELEYKRGLKKRQLQLLTELKRQSIFYKRDFTLNELSSDSKHVSTLNLLLK